MFLNTEINEFYKHTNCFVPSDALVRAANARMGIEVAFQRQSLCQSFMDNKMEKTEPPFFKKCLTDLEVEEQIDCFMMQPARESCRKIFISGLATTDTDSVLTITNRIFQKSNFVEVFNPSECGHYFTPVKEEFGNNASITTEELQQVVRSLLSSAMKCETDEKGHPRALNENSHWCEICLVYDPKGQSKHMEYHVAPVTHFLKRVLGNDDTIQTNLSLSNAENHAQNLVHFNCVFDKGLDTLKNTLISKQKRWLNLLLLEILNFTSCISKFEIESVRNLPQFGDDGGFMKNRLLSTEEGDATLFSYINAIDEFVKLLKHMTNKNSWSFNTELERLLSDQEQEIANFLKRTGKLCTLMTLLLKGWRESVKPKRELETQATKMLSTEIWFQSLSFVLEPDLRKLLSCFGTYMASYHGGNVSRSGIEAILLLISDMLSSMYPFSEDPFEFKIEHLNNLHIVFAPGGWLDQTVDQPYYMADTSLRLPFLSVNKFLTFLEIYNWYEGYFLDLGIVYKRIHGMCFPDYQFDIFKSNRL